ncbi:7tm 6 domain containing protein [Asbolus verrucosus]|uniref:7tm 6 domain containing protein n=1 Tax=Asbolus verrucosus TaxID=1661398 RepID=A0A482W836_ASBVE|nr:7tm 6 domain containing protein [Asbolus verrucosus]
MGFDIRSDTIGQSFYMSKWYESDIGVRKLLLIFLENTKKPSLIRAGNFITLSLQTLTQE